MLTMTFSSSNSFAQIGKVFEQFLVINLLLEKINHDEGFFAVKRHKRRVYHGASVDGEPQAVQPFLCLRHIRKHDVFQVHAFSSNFYVAHAAAGKRHDFVAVDTGEEIQFFGNGLDFFECFYVKDIVIFAPVLAVAHLQHDQNLVGTAEFRFDLVVQLGVRVVAGQQVGVNRLDRQVRNGLVKKENRNADHGKQDWQPFFDNKVCYAFHVHGLYVTPCADFSVELLTCKRTPARQAAKFKCLGH